MLHDTIIGQLRKAHWATGVPFVNAAVMNGAVDLSGFVDLHEQRQAIRVLAENTPGTHVVHDELQIMPRRVHWD